MILLHGLGRSWRAMLALAWRLRRAGFAVTNLAYPSRSKSVSDIVTDHLQPALAALRLEPGARVHFVTHSLGGIVFRAWAAQRQADFPLGKTVLLAAPNQGNEIADHLADRGWVHRLLGPVVSELGTKASSLANSLGPVPPETLVVMGNQVRIQLFSHLFGSDHDGVVSVERGHVEGEAGFHVMKADHTFIMWRKPVLDLVEQHLRKAA
ncbi:MAG: alpha/beta fold hydrolase [Verrucomicrobiota bacterium]